MNLVKKLTILAIAFLTLSLNDAKASFDNIIMHDLKILCLKHLPIKDLNCCARLSKRMKTASESDIVWESHKNNLFPFDDLSMVATYSPTAAEIIAAHPKSKFKQLIRFRTKIVTEINTNAWYASISANILVANEVVGFEALLIKAELLGANPANIKSYIDTFVVQIFNNRARYEDTEAEKANFIERLVTQGSRLALTFKQNEYGWPAL